VFAGKKSAQIREILISESAWEEMTCLFAPSLVSDNGDVYAKLAVKKLANDCLIQRSIGQSGELNNKECNIMIRANKAD
ncbi:hypothetical protein ACTA03_21935, partial [Enterobacter hormaechei subsp. xiangfangensis]